MSMTYWVIEGVGLNTDSIYDYIDKEKLATFLHQQLPDDQEVTEMYLLKQYDALDVEEFLHGEPFYNLGDLLTHCDQTDTLTFGDDGENGSYLYYPPSMPWERVANDPQSIDEVYERIIDAVQMITSGLTHKQIESMIQDDLYVVGMG